MSREFKRSKDQFPFAFNGIKVNDRADALPPGKYPLAINIRSYDIQSIRTRPGLGLLFSQPLATPYVTDMNTLSALSTDDQARIYTRNKDDSVWLENTSVGSLSGGGTSNGASMIPFRPDQSPNPWMYIANGSDYQKFSSPTGSVTKKKVGIAEPQASPEAYIGTYYFSQMGGTFTAAGTAAAAGSSVRVTDTVQSAPVSDPNVSMWSVPVTSSVSYQKLMLVTIAGDTFLINDVFAPLSTPVTISAIYYFSGSTGHCIIYPANLGVSYTTEDQSIFSANLMFCLRRGALLKIGTDVCYVWSVIEGPDGTISIETSTSVNHVAGATMTTLPAIQVLGGTPTAAQAISWPTVTSAVSTGIGTLTSTMAGTNPFVLGNISFQPDDYITFGIKIDTLTNLNEIKIMFDVGDGTFTQNFFYYTIRPSDIIAAIANTSSQLATVQTLIQRAIIDQETAIAAGNQQLTSSSAMLDPGSSQWTQIVFPISALTFVGSDQSKSLQNVNHLQVLINCSGTVNIAIDGGYVFGGYQPDVGDIGAPYIYRVRPRSSQTGVKGNPSPATRYGVNPRRMQVQLTLPSAAYDSQIDTWDIFRYGGSVTSWRFVGSCPSSATYFYDNFSDDSVGAGEALDFDNLEPWPSIDYPLNVTTTTVVGPIVIATLAAIGNVPRYLPGTLVRIGGINVYTLRKRPVQISGLTYLFEFVESASANSGSIMYIQEPNVAFQPNLYMFGPDAAGTIFGCGDSLRPGTLSFTKTNNPDCVPDSYNTEIVQPSEPLLGGEIIDGLAFVASSNRWWALYPQFSNPLQRYNVVQYPVNRGLAAPFGHCNDGIAIYWWAKDGIYSSKEGSLTDADLYTLFPHEGIAGVNFTYNGYTYVAPDYTQTDKFRLTYSNNYLYATYMGTNGNFYCLVCFIPRKAWSADVYPMQITSILQVYQKPEQNGALNPSLILAGTSPTGGTAQASVFQQVSDINDNSIPISCVVSTAEYNGEDVRAPKQWGDIFLDCLPLCSSGITATPMSLGAGVAPAYTVPQSSIRVRVPISVGGIVISDFMGLFLTWTDNFLTQFKGTKLYLWQPSFADQPAREISWTSFGSSFGMKGYFHLKQIDLAWVSTAQITITPISYDGLDPVPIIIPSSGGAYQKQLFTFTPNKGLLFNFQVSSTAQFQIFNEDTELYVGEWGRTEEYTVFRGFGGRTIDDAPI